ncbi:MAG: hypothetical protein EGQ76_04935 [Sutterella sp.]|nr:hypothetical protein [Sutterella sp.]
MKPRAVGASRGFFAGSLKPRLQNFFLPEARAETDTAVQRLRAYCLNLCLKAVLSRDPVGFALNNPRLKARGFLTRCRLSR